MCGMRKQKPKELTLSRVLKDEGAKRIRERAFQSETGTSAKALRSESIWEL